MAQADTFRFYLNISKAKINRVSIDNLTILTFYRTTFKLIRFVSFLLGLKNG